MGHKGSKRAAKRVVTHKVLLSICTKHQNTNRKTIFNFPLSWISLRIRLITQKRTTDKNLHLLPPHGSRPCLKTQKNKISEKDSLKLHFLFLFLVHLCFRFLTMVAGCAEQQTPGGKSTDVGGGECPCYTGGLALWLLYPPSNMYPLIPLHF